MHFPFFDFEPTPKLALGIAIGFVVSVFLRTAFLHG